MDLHLLGQDVISDLLTVFSVVGPLSKHALVGDDTHGKVVHSYTVILTAHDFRSHVAWGARRVLGVLWVPATGNSEIGDSQIAILVKDEVLRLDISV